MKAICVKDVSNRLTEGKEYEVLDAGDGTYGIINDKGNLWWAESDCFRPVPEPVNEWMQIDDGSFINMKTGMMLNFGKQHCVQILNTSSEHRKYAFDQYAEAFAQMVGYKWEE